MNPGASVLLNSNVSIRFYLTKPDTLVNFDNYKYGYVKSNNDLGAYGAIHYIEEPSGYYKLDETYYQSKDGVKAVNNDVDVQTNVIEVDGCEQTQYYIDVPVCAREFADTITIAVTGNNGENPLFETRTYSVKEYCQKRIANHANDDVNSEEGKNGLATRKLAMAMLNYGTAMQKYKNYNTDNLANAEVLKAYNAMVVKTTPTEKKKLHTRITSEQEQPLRQKHSTSSLQRMQAPRLVLVMLIQNTPHPKLKPASASDCTVSLCLLKTT